MAERRGLFKVNPAGIRSRNIRYPLRLPADREPKAVAFQKVLCRQLADFHVVALDVRQGDLVVDQRGGDRGDAG